MRGEHFRRTTNNNATTVCIENISSIPYIHSSLYNIYMYMDPFHYTLMMSLFIRRDERTFLRARGERERDDLSSRGSRRRGIIPARELSYSIVPSFSLMGKTSCTSGAPRQ